MVTTHTLLKGALDERLGVVPISEMVMGQSLSPQKIAQELNTIECSLSVGVTMQVLYEICASTR